MPTAIAEPVSLRVKLSLPEEIVAQYEALARNSGSTIEAYLSRRLVATIGQTSQRPIYLADADRQALESTLRMNIGSARGLIDAVKKLAVVSFGEEKINLPENVVHRLRGRCPHQVHFGDFLKNNVLALIEQFVGLR